MTWELTPELEERILTGLEDGVGLVRLCQQDDMPSRRTVLRWQREDEAFGAKCAHAREAAGEISFERLEDINEKVEQGLLEPAAASIISSNLKWRAAKLDSKKYGDKQDVKLTVHKAPLKEDDEALLRDYTSAN